MKQVILVLLVTSVAGCGGFHKAKRDVGYPQSVRTAAPAPIPITPTVVGVTTPGAAQTLTVAAAPAAAVIAPAPVAKPFASGPIKNACMASDRQARSRDLCGCIQAVADEELSVAQQRLAVSFYNDPHSAQEIRQSDNSSHRDFWDDYKAYGEAAERTCS